MNEPYSYIMVTVKDVRVYHSFFSIFQFNVFKINIYIP